MKKVYLLLGCVFHSFMLFAQSNHQQASIKSLIGSYEGYQPSYSMGHVNGRDIIVPGSTYSFKISSGNKVKLSQVADNGATVSYTGKYIISSKDNTTILSCQMIEDAYKYPSKPKFFITVDNKTNRIICQQDTDHTPPFELKINN